MRFVDDRLANFSRDNYLRIGRMRYALATIYLLMPDFYTIIFIKYNILHLQYDTIFYMLIIIILVFPFTTFILLRVAQRRIFDFVRKRVSFILLYFLTLVIISGAIYTFSFLLESISYFLISSECIIFSKSKPLCSSELLVHSAQHFILLIQGCPQRIFGELFVVMIIRYLLIFGIGVPPSLFKQNFYGIPPAAAQIERRSYHSQRITRRFEKSLLREKELFPFTFGSTSSPIKKAVFASKSGMLWRWLCSSTADLAGRISLYLAIAVPIGLVTHLFYDPTGNIEKLINLVVYLPLLPGLYFLIVFGERVFMPIRIMNNLVKLTYAESIILYLRPFSNDRLIKITPRKRGLKTGLWRLNSADNIVASDITHELFGKDLEKGDVDIELDFETFVANTLDSAGALVALGADDIGICRLHSTDLDWKEKFLLLAKKAKSILYVPGPTPGSLKEFEVIIEQFSKKSLVISLPATDVVTVLYWREPGLLLERAWNDAIRALRGRRPNWAFQLDLLKYDREGALYRINLDNEVVEKFALTAENLQLLVTGKRDALEVTTDSEQT